MTDSQCSTTRCKRPEHSRVETPLGTRKKCCPCAKSYRQGREAAGGTLVRICPTCDAELTDMKALVHHRINEHNTPYSQQLKIALGMTEGEESEEDVDG